MMRYTRAFFISLFVLSSFFMVASMGAAEKKKEPRAVFEGEVADISGRFITVGRTAIALPKKIRVIDPDGAALPFNAIKKGDYLLVTIEKNESILQKLSGPRKDRKEKPSPQ